jgi:hypothetical protein
MSKTLELTFYKTNKDYENNTAMLEPFDPDDWKSIKVTFTKENDCWVVKQPIDFKFKKISDSWSIINKLNCSEVEPLYKLKINKSYHPLIEEITYIIPDPDSDLL